MEPLIVRLEGEWGISRREELRATVARNIDVPLLIWDLRAVTHIDSTTLRELARSRAIRRSRSLPPAAFVVTSPTVRRIFVLTQLDKIWPIYHSLEEAVGSFGGDDAPPGS